MIKELKNNGYRFMCNCKASGLSVFDMDVEDNVEKIEKKFSRRILVTSVVS